MSLENWMKKYYPKEINENMTPRQAVIHSLRKWNGLSDDALKKYNLEKYGHGIREKDGFGSRLRIDDTSCALCEVFFYPKDDDGTICGLCPLCNLLGHPCDTGFLSPYVRWLDDDDPKPMINALQKILDDKLY